MKYKVLAESSLGEHHRLVEYEGGRLQVEWWMAKDEIGGDPKDGIWVKQRKVDTLFLSGLFKVLIKNLENKDLTIKQFTEANKKRLETYTDKGTKPITYWGCCLGGEVGELLNLLKKLEDGRIKEASMEMIGKEIADIETYLDLVAIKLGIDREKVLRAKFNEVSGRYKCDVKI